MPDYLLNHRTIVSVMTNIRK